MEIKNLVTESIWIVDYLWSVFFVILNCVNNVKYSSKRYLIFNIAGEFLQISDENKIISRLNQIASKLEELVSCSNLRKININRDENFLTINYNIVKNRDFLFQLVFTKNFKINIYFKQLNHSNDNSIIISKSLDNNIKSESKETMYKYKVPLKKRKYRRLRNTTQNK